MISIVICSRTQNISPELFNNIQKTIGVPFELVLIDNSKNEYSIFSAYNLGVERSTKEIICFMHDDLYIETLNWGEKIIERFKETNIGAIGIAGTPYYAVLPGGWWSGGYICQHLSGKEDLIYKPIHNEALPVVALDGVWFCIKKSLFKEIRFDEVNFSGFHFYDVDICLQINQLGYPILSVYDITIKHESGKLDKIWLKNALIVQKKWRNILPLSVEKISYPRELKIEYSVMEEYIQAMQANGSGKIKQFMFIIIQLFKHRLKRFKLSFLFIFVFFFIRYIIKKLS